ncbi:hypothetical protein ACFSTC_10780 [Nonomuraea ferruginea]
MTTSPTCWLGKASDFIAADGRPFFLFLAPVAPHLLSQPSGTARGGVHRGHGAQAAVVQPGGREQGARLAARPAPR